jgi:hypothetical protein
LQKLENEHFKVERGGLTATTRSNPQLLVTGPQKIVVFGPLPPTKGVFQNALSAAAAAATPVMPAAALSTIRMITKTQTQYGDSFRRYPNGRYALTPGAFQSAKKIRSSSQSSIPQVMYENMLQQ